jgi:hypothetical protein
VERVAGAVGERWLEEDPGQPRTRPRCRRVGRFVVAVVPVGEGPGRRATEFGDLRADDHLEEVDVGAVPGQEVLPHVGVAVRAVRPTLVPRRGRGGIPVLPLASGPPVHGTPEEVGVRPIAELPGVLDIRRAADRVILGILRCGGCVTLSRLVPAHILQRLRVVQADRVPAGRILYRKFGDHAVVEVSDVVAHERRRVGHGVLPLEWVGAASYAGAGQSSPGMAAPSSVGRWVWDLLALW